MIEKKDKQTKRIKSFLSSTTYKYLKALNQLKKLIFLNWTILFYYVQVVFNFNIRCLCPAKSTGTAVVVMSVYYKPTPAPTPKS